MSLLVFTASVFLICTSVFAAPPVSIGVNESTTVTCRGGNYLDVVQTTPGMSQVTCLKACVLTLMSDSYSNNQNGGGNQYSCVSTSIPGNPSHDNCGNFKSADEAIAAAQASAQQNIANGDCSRVINSNF